MQSLTFRSMSNLYGLVEHPIMEVSDLIRYYESRGYAYRHRSMRAGYVPRMTPGNCIVANYSGRFGQGIQIAEGYDSSRVIVHYLIKKGVIRNAKAQAAETLGN